MSTEFETNTDNTEDTFSAQDDDKMILFKWSAIIAAVMVLTCLGTTSLLKVVGLISASWLWVVAAAGSIFCVTQFTCSSIARPVGSGLC